MLLSLGVDWLEPVSLDPCSQLAMIRTLPLLCLKRETFVQVQQVGTPSSDLNRRYSETLSSYQ